MGKGREGDVKHIANLAAATGVFELDVVDDRGPGEVRIPRDFKPEAPSEWGEPVDPLANATKAERRAWSKKNQAKAMRAWSSTNVRYLLAHGRIQDANAILGAPHSIEGEVVHGEERGRTIGFPTANLGSDIAGYIPVDGVYAGGLVDGENRWPAAISIGTKPTFSEKTGLNERVVEAYCITEECQIHTLDQESSIRELARLLGGAQITDAVLENAREMKKLAGECKAGL